MRSFMKITKVSPNSRCVKPLGSGKDVVMRVDVQGAETVRKLVPEALLIFLAPKDEDELVRRLTSSQKRRCQRVEASDRDGAAGAEGRSTLFDYVVINQDDHLDETLDLIEAIIAAGTSPGTPQKGSAMTNIEQENPPPAATDDLIGTEKRLEAGCYLFTHGDHDRGLSASDRHGVSAGN